MVSFTFLSTALSFFTCVMVLHIDLCTNNPTHNTTVYTTAYYIAHHPRPHGSLLPTHPIRPQKTSLCGGTVSACSLPWLTCTSKQRTATSLVRRRVSMSLRVTAFSFASAEYI